MKTDQPVKTAPGTPEIRLAIRAEGEFVTAYIALVNTMEGAQLIGTIRRSFLDGQSDELFQAWMQVMRDTMERGIKDLTGATPTWGEPCRAPEHERAGHG